MVLGSDKTIEVTEAVPFDLYRFFSSLNKNQFSAPFFEKSILILSLPSFSLDSETKENTVSVSNGQSSLL